MKRIMIAGVAAAGLAGCATTGGAPDQAAAAPEPAMTCRAETAQGHIGHAATQAMGTAILKDSGARTLRWGPPNSAWTMDFREDRVNVRYDEAMKITEITCG
ncbi:I78 family peptidase inhibitor [Erythrobacter donghaensis]|jgi:hypothetical protein|uniref:I78 family peptidase inhibitor n=1 Tax=Erythrobacter donghaensis TaxID=267135 RepID=UPI00093D4974|nr:I78 family peptidase inhibitor [Erythrobacter donghaensis]